MLDRTGGGHLQPVRHPSDATGPEALLVKEVAQLPATHRAIIASVTPIAIPLSRAGELRTQTIRRLAAGQYPVFQLDATAYPGNSGSPLYDAATGEVIGIVNKVFVQGTIWNINSFDQWGVELGKALAEPLIAAVRDGVDSAGADASTRGLVAHVGTEDRNPVQARRAQRFLHLGERGTQVALRETHQRFAGAGRR